MASSFRTPIDDELPEDGPGDRRGAVTAGIVDGVSIGRPEQRSTRIGFFIAGFAMAAWAPLVPFAKARTGLDDGGLGLLLLGLGGGSIVAMPLAGALAARFGCRALLLAATTLVGVCLPLLATLSHPPLLGLALVCFGAGIGSVDCAINIQAVIVERASGRPMMSGFHGLFSVGGIAGAGGVSLLLSLGASPFASSLVVVGCTALALAAAAPNLLSVGGTSGGPAFAIPHGIVLFIGMLCFVVFLTEGAMLDWSAVFLAAVRGVDPVRAGLGYAAFASAMTVGRLSGDPVVRRFGGPVVIAAGAACAAVGLCIAALVPVWAGSLVGFLLVGAGCSNIVPVLYTAVGRQRTMPEHIAVPAITTMGYAGILAGPALIGLMAHVTSLTAAFVVIAITLLGVSASGVWMRGEARAAR